MKFVYKYYLVIIIFSLIMTMYNCKKDNIVDYRDKITGEYRGIKIFTYWTGTGSNFTHDTSDVSLRLLKSDSDSILDLVFSPSILENDYSFKYHNNVFMSISSEHKPSLTMSKDTIYFHYQPGLGPNWYDCIVKK